MGKNPRRHAPQLMNAAKRPILPYWFQEGEAPGYQRGQREERRARAVLSDMDGVFFELVDHFGEFGVSPRLDDEIKLVYGLHAPLGRLLNRGFLILGITNQPDISRRNITRGFLARKHEALLGEYPEIGKIFVCEHDEGDKCDCRKPKPGLLIQAAGEFGLDLPACWLLGDSGSDIEAGLAVNARTAFVRTQYNATDPGCDRATLVANGPLEAFALVAEIAENEMGCAPLAR